MSAFPINRGRGSRRDPLGADLSDLATVEEMLREIITIAEKHGDCWVYMGRLEKNYLNEMFRRGMISPVPRVARQPRDLARFQATAKGREWITE